MNVTQLYSRQTNSPSVLSLSIISHNDPNLLEQCLPSVDRLNDAAQVEVVILLDHSPQDYADAVVEHARQSPVAIQVYRAQERTSKGLLRNKSAQLAGSQYVAFLDSDCEIDPDYVHVAKKLIATGILSTDIVVGQVDFKPNQTWFSQHNCQHRADGYEFFWRTWFRTPNALVNRHLFFSKTGGFEDVCRHGDDFLVTQKVQWVGIPVHYAEDLVVTHYDDSEPRTTVRKWFGYGLDAAYRWKRERTIFGKKVAPIWSAFFRHQHYTHTTFPHRVFHWSYWVINNIGTAYGLVRHWRHTQMTLPFDLPDDATPSTMHRTPSM